GAFRRRVVPPSPDGAGRAADALKRSRRHHLVSHRFSTCLAPLLQQRRGSRSPARGVAAVTLWQKIKRELGRETQPVDTVVRLIILERAIRGSLVFILGIALLTRSRSVVTLVRQWVAELDVNPERRSLPRAPTTVPRAVGPVSPRPLR